MDSVFQESLKDDLENIFFNNLEFATLHKIGDTMYEVVVDDEILATRKIRDDIENISIGSLLFFIKENELGYKPRIETKMVFDDKAYLVVDVKEDFGLLEIMLQIHEGR